MKLRHIVLGVAVVVGGVLALANLQREPGSATVAAERRLLAVHVVDRCGNEVQEPDGSPMIVQFRLDPPPLEGAVAQDDPTAAQLPPVEGTQVGVLLPADPRKPTEDVTVECAYLRTGGGP